MRRARNSDSFRTPTSETERLSHLVFVRVDVNDSTWFSVLLTRVPGHGEFIQNDGDVFRVTAVHQVPVDAAGKSSCGLQAIVDVEVEPGDETR